MLCFACRWSVLLLALMTLTSSATAQVFDERFEDWPLDLKIRGRVVLAGTLAESGILRGELAPRSKGQQAILVLDLADGTEGERLLKSYQTLLASYKDELTVVKRTAKEAASGTPDFEKLLTKCDLFCWHSAATVTEQLLAALRKSQAVLKKHLQAGKTLAVIGPAAACCGGRLVVDGSDLAGLNLVPDSVVSLDYTDSPAQRGQVLSVLALHSRRVGIGIASDTAMILAGRQLHVAGPGKVTCLLMANEREPLRVESIIAPVAPPTTPERHLIDLTQWRREAIERASEPFPPAEPATPLVENGALVIVGGGGMPAGLMDHFIELAGGLEKARLVYVPCTELDQIPPVQRNVEAWKKQGVKHATFLHTKDRQQANQDEDFLRPLKEATGIWFGGGRQWNMADSYYGTKAHAMMKDVLRRGGVIGGSSAGASIQARYLARATPIRNLRIMAPGYERGGLGFISGVAIDQHFAQRGRHKDMTQLMAKHPQLLGIGLDEATAIVVQKSIAEVTGRGQVHFYNRRLPVYPDQPDYLSLKSGSRYDLAERVELPPEPAEAADPPAAEKPADSKLLAK